MKFKSPLKGTLWITQNYHTNSSNRAVDFSAVADAPVYAVGDGEIKAHYTNLGSYCTFILDNSKVKMFYVHTYKWIASGKKVKAGDIICYVAPSTLNGGHLTHLHLGTQLDYSLMDYMDRTLKYDTKYADIRKSWFLSDGKLNWSLFKDRTFLISEPTPPEAPEPTECDKQLKILQDSFDSLLGDYRALEVDRSIKAQEIVELVKSRGELQEKYDTLYIERNRLENEKNEAIAKLKAGSLVDATTGEIFSELWKRITRSIR